MCAKMNIPTIAGLKSCGPTIFVYKQAIATFASSCLALSGGLTFGISAVLLPQLKEDHTFPYDQTYESWIASITTLSMAIGCLFTGTILDIFGRKACHMILNIPYIIGWLLIIFAERNWLILVGRFSSGISAGAFRPIIMVYIGEIADPIFRSTALIFPSLMTSIGILLSHVIGQYFYWKTSIFICLVPAVSSALMYLLLRESPLWLISKGKFEEGIQTFKWFRGDGEIAEKELNAVLEKQKEKVTRLTVQDFLDLLRSASFMKPFLVVLQIMFCAQACGVNIIMAYTLDIYNNMFSKLINSFILMVASDCIKTLVAIIICVFASNLPKAKAFLICCFGLFTTLTSVIVFLYIKPSGFNWLPLCCILLYTVFSCGIVMWGWAFVPEMLLNSARGIGSSMVSFTSFLFLFTGIKVTPAVVATYGLLAMFGLFAILTFISGVVLIFVIPETNGKSLQAIEDDYNKRKVDIIQT